MHAPALAAPVPSSYALSDGVTSATFAIDATVGPRLVSIGDAREPAAHGFASDVGLWSVRLWNGNDIDISAAQAQCATRTISQSGSGAAALLTLSWGDCASSKLDSTDRFDVTIKAKLGADHALAMTIDVTTRIPNKVLRAVEFPRLSINSRGAVKDQVLSYPQVGGWLLKAPLNNPILKAAGGAAMSMPGTLSMQWFSYYDASKTDAAVLFFGTRDDRGRLKEVIFDQPTATTLPMRLRHVMAVPLAAPLDNDYSAPFPFVLRVLRGGWLEAADFYRSWATTQPWTQQGPMRSNTSFSSIIRDARVFAANTLECQGKVCDSAGFNSWLTDIDEQRKRYGVKAIPQLQYKWHHGPELGESGDWLPVHAPVISNGPGLAAAGHAWAPYFYNLSFNYKLPTFTSSDVPGHVGQSVLPHVVKNIDQTPVVGGGSGVEPTAVLCPHTSFMRDYSVYIAKKLQSQAGAQGIYLDVFNATPPQRCYDPSHGHPLGGGDTYMQGLIATARHLRKELRKSEPQFFVYSEGLNEMLLGEIELGYTHLTAPSAPAASWRPHIDLVPLFETVYGDYMMITSLLYQLKAPAFKAIPAQTAMSIRASYAGQLDQGAMPPTGAFVGPTALSSVINNNAPWLDLWALAVSTVDVIKQPVVADYFVFGRRRRNLHHDAPTVETTASSNDLRRQVVVSTWRSDTRPGVGLLLINWTAATDTYATAGATGGNRTVSLTLSATQLGLAPGDYDLIDETAQGAKTLRRITLGSAPLIEPIKVPALSARFVRIVPAAASGDGGAGGSDAGDGGAGASDGGSDGSDDVGGGPDAGAGADGAAIDGSSSSSDSRAGADASASADAGSGGNASGGCALGGPDATSRPTTLWLLLLLGLLACSRRRA